MNEEKNQSSNEIFNNQSIEPASEEAVPVQPNYNNGKKSKHIGMFLSVVLIIAAIIGYFTYTTLNSPKNLFLGSINGAYKNVENLLDEKLINNKLLDNKAVLSKADLDFKVSVDESLLDENTKKILDEVNKIKLNSEVGYDKKNKEVSTKFGATYDNKDLLNVAAYATNENIYVELKKIFDKYIEIPVEDYNALFESQKDETEDIKYITKTFKDAVVNNMDKNNFKKSKETVKINSKEVKTTKVEYSLNQKDAKKLAESTIQTLIKNDKFVEKVSNVTAKEKSEIKETLNNALDKVKAGTDEDLVTDASLKIAIYVKGITNKNVGFKISFLDETEDTIVYLKNDKVTEIKLNEDSKEVLNIKVTDKSKTESDIAIGMEGLVLNIHKVIDGEKTTFDYEMKATEELIVKGALALTQKEITKDVKYEANLDFNMSLIMNNEEMMGIKIKSNGSVEYTDKLNLPDVSNSVKYTDLTETDTNTIMNNLMKNQNLITLIQKISGYASSMNSISNNYDYSEDYDF